MPVTAANTLLGGVGVLTALGSVVAYRRKATVPFKLAYALTWPILGSATILLLQPSAPEVERKLSAEEAARLAHVRALNAGTMAALQVRTRAARLCVACLLRAAACCSEARAHASCATVRLRVCGG
jgi:hypothetical protein